MLDNLKAAWSRVRDSAGVFAHSAVVQFFEVELAKVLGDVNARLEAVEKAAGVTPPAPIVETPTKPAA